MTDPEVRILDEARAREKGQTLFYRALAAEAESRGEVELAERLNALHADEQHHLSRLTARVLELGAEPVEVKGSPSEVPDSGNWETMARSREGAEVAWYEAALKKPMDPVTRTLLREILESEQHHSRELGGKWMSA